MTMRTAVVALNLVLIAWLAAVLAVYLVPWWLISTAIGVYAVGLVALDRVR